MLLVRLRGDGPVAFGPDGKPVEPPPGSGPSTGELTMLNGASDHCRQRKVRIAAKQAAVLCCAVLLWACG